VTEGIVVVRLDPEIEKSRVNQAKANLIMAEAKLDKATISRKDKKIRLERQKSLYRDRIISEQELDDAEIEYEMSVSDIKIAEAEILRLKEALREAEDRLGDTEIPAPITGTILEKFVERGQIITSGTTSTTEGTSLFTMADLNKIYISASVDETDVGRVEPGQAVSITVDAYTGLAFEGRVLRIAPKGRVESTITVFDVIVEVIDREKTKLKPAMTANVEVLTAFKKNILLVPSEAVRVVSEEFGVYLMKGGEPMSVPLTIGDSNGISTEIQGDVKEGLEVIVSRVELGAREENAGLRSWSLRRVLGSFHKRR
jgi:HlyD family secretion protein